MYKYDVALSYDSACENVREYVENVADLISGQKRKVFFSPFYETEMISASLSSQLYNVFSVDSNIKVLFLTDNYMNKRWTSLEARTAIHETRFDISRLILVRFSKIKIANLPSDACYIDGNKKYFDETASIILERIKSTCISGQIKLTSDDNKQRSKYSVNQNNGIIAGDMALFHGIKISNIKK